MRRNSMLAFKILLVIGFWFASKRLLNIYFPYVCRYLGNEIWGYNILGMSW